MLEAIYNKGGGFKYLKVFQRYDESQFDRDATKLLEKHNAEDWRAIAKLKPTQTFFVEVFNKELAKHLLKLMGLQEFQNPEKISEICVKNRNSIVNKTNSTNPLITDIKTWYCWAR